MEVDEVGGRWTFSRANEGYTSCGPVVEMSWHRAGVLLLGAQSCLPVPGVPAVGGIGSVLLSMARMGWKLCHVFRLYTVVGFLLDLLALVPPDIDVCCSCGNSAAQTEGNIC
uniref:B1159F04.12 protein n=1 Tax=Oryza sativa subsp. japonica TaxID=39947 RepID=Q6MWI8_ORYSJ|nr:B1159F04.12 [Oryza sativa Japonica Group]